MARAAIITGASRGIGAAVAERLAKDGFSVVVNYAGSEAEAAALVNEIKSAGGRAIAAKADVSKADEVSRMFEVAEKEFGGVDVLVNNAGIMLLSNVATTHDTVFDRQIAVNLRGTFNGLREAAKRLRNGGRVINFSTSVVGLKLETYGVYAATKAAVETLTAILSKELRGRSITVNAIAPRPTATAKMGTDDMSVVDSKLWVYGVKNLRVADGSIMPRVTTGNTHAPCAIIGERMAEMLSA